MKSIAFFISSNGYGHYDRCKEIASYLNSDVDITFFSNNFQYKKLGLPTKYKFIELEKNTIRWDKNLAKNKIRFKSYKEGLKEKSNYFKKYDIIISDNIVGILKYRPDTILSGSFFWKDTFLSKFGKNKLTYFDNNLLSKHNPLLLTNKYLEIGEVKKYTNRKQFGFGCPELPYKLNKTTSTVFIKPSLNYLQSYNEFADKISTKYTTDIKKTKETCLIARPGGGIITHCVKHYIPLIAIYDENDSNEIIELAHNVEKLGIGYKHNIKDKLNLDFIEDNSIYKDTQLIKNGYKKAAEFISSVL